MITEQQFLLELAYRIEAPKDAADAIMHIKRGHFMRTRALIRDAGITEDHTLPNLASWYRAFHKLEEVKQLLAVAQRMAPKQDNFRDEWEYLENWETMQEFDNIGDAISNLQDFIEGKIHALAGQCGIE